LSTEVHRREHAAFPVLLRSEHHVSTGEKRGRPSRSITTESLAKMVD
jgi:hypothetical protein